MKKLVAPVLKGRVTKPKHEKCGQEPVPHTCTPGLDVADVQRQKDKVDHDRLDPTRTISAAGRDR